MWVVCVCCTEVKTACMHTHADRWAKKWEKPHPVPWREAEAALHRSDLISHHVKRRRPAREAKRPSKCEVGKVCDIYIYRGEGSLWGTWRTTRQDALMRRLYLVQLTRFSSEIHGEELEIKPSATVVNDDGDSRVSQLVRTSQLLMSRLHLELYLKGVGLFCHKKSLIW